MLDINDFEKTGEYRDVKAGEYFVPLENACFKEEVMLCTANDKNKPRYILKPKERTMKYEQIKTIRAETILAHKPSTNDFGIYLKHFGYGTADLNALIRFAIDSKHSCWIDWLINHGFIEEVKEEEVYHAGNKFIVDRGYGDPSRYQLRCHSLSNGEDDYCAGLFSEEYGSDWIGIMVNVKERETITSENINNMIPNYTWKEVKK